MVLMTGKFTFLFVSAEIPEVFVNLLLLGMQSLSLWLLIVAGFGLITKVSY